MLFTDKTVPIFICVQLTDGARTTTDMVAARNTLTNGLNAARAMVGQSGVTNGMKTLIPTAVV